MTDSEIIEVLDRVRTWPRERQEELARIALARSQYARPMKLRFSIEATAHIAKRPSQAHEADSPKVPRLRIAQSGDGCGGLFLHRLERWHSPVCLAVQPPP
jgi:hypothetical protein